MNVSKEIKDSNVKYVCGGIKHVIENFGKRGPGSEGERNAQIYMGGELAKYCDNVVLEDFKVAPGSFFGWIPITVSITLLAAACYFYIPLIALSLILIAAIPMLTQFVFYKKTFDPLFKEKISCNLIASKKPTDEVKRRMVLCGHADAAWEWTLSYKFGGGIVLLFTLSLLGMIYLLIISAVACFKNGIGARISFFGGGLWAGIGLSAFIPLWISMYFFANKKVVVDGANDDLSACFTSIAALKVLKEAEISLKNTEVVVFLSGSQEAGLRGAKAWCELHPYAYTDVETVFIPLETLHEVDCLTVYQKDLNGLVKTDEDVCNLLSKSAEEAGYKVRYGSVSVGATDAAAFTQAGRKAACLGALDHNLKPYYHTRKDSYDNLSPECLSAALDIVLQALKNYDEKGLEN